MTVVRCTGTLVAILLGHSILFARPADAQRSGFFIDAGLGPGLVSSNTTLIGFGSSERETKVGVAANLNLGGGVGRSLELYWSNHLIFHITSRQQTNRAVTGISGVGATYPLSPALAIKGTLGFSHQTLSIDSWGNIFDTSIGLGLQAGARYGLGDRWGLDLDVMYASWNDGPNMGSEEVSLWSASLTLNWLSAD